MVRTEMDSMPTELDEINRRIMQHEIEETALKKESDKLSQEHLLELQKELADMRAQFAAMKARWENEKTAIQSVQKLREELEAVNADIEKAQREYDLNRAAELKYGRLPELQKRLAEEEEKAEASQRGNNGTRLLRDKVTDEEIAKIVGRWTHIPVSRLMEGEREKLLRMEDILHQRVIGQDEAVKKVTEAILRSRAGIQDPGRPIGSFLFLGPTGVGKTELVKVLSQELFDNVEPLIRLDMSEYMEKHSVSRIIGSPPGYVGYDEAGQLTEKVRRRPYSIVLLDEIEKAHPDVLNILLQILDEGKITDAQGRVVSFENTILIMTSNAGSQLKEGSLGFTKSGVQMARDKAEKALSDFLRPEFLARVDEVIIFRPLTKEDFQGIAALMIDELKPSLLEKGIRFDCQPQVLEQIAGDAFGHKSGARDIRKLIRQRIEDPICVMLASGESPALMMAVLTEEGKVALQTA